VNICWLCLFLFWVIVVFYVKHRWVASKVDNTIIYHHWRCYYEDWRWCEHYNMRFWDLCAPWLELLRAHIWPSMQNLWPSFAKCLGHYNTFWVLWLVNKMTNVFVNYNCNYMVMLMTIVAKDIVVPWFCNCSWYDNLMIFNANMIYIVKLKKNCNFLVNKYNSWFCDANMACYVARCHNVWLLNFVPSIFLEFYL
jgi:hypothetical protein